MPLMDSTDCGRRGLSRLDSRPGRVTGQLADSDQDVRSLLRNGPATADEASRLQRLKPTLPVLLANMTSARPGGADLPAEPRTDPRAAAAVHGQSVVRGPDQPIRPAWGKEISPSRSVTHRRARWGFSRRARGAHRRTPTEVDTPDGMYCKLPQDSPLAVRGARNYPCMRASPAKGHRPSRSATATSRFSRLRCVSTCSVPIRWTRI